MRRAGRSRPGGYAIASIARPGGYAIASIASRSRRTPSRIAPSSSEP